MKNVNVYNQLILTKKQKKHLILIGAILGFISGFGFFALKVTEHTKESKQFIVKRIHNEH